MTTFIVTDSAGLVIAETTVPESDLPHQPVPEGYTRHVGLTARPLKDKLVGGKIVSAEVEATAEEAKAALLSRLADRRWKIETGGVQVGSMNVATDDRSKLLIVNAAKIAREDPAHTVRWKIGPGLFVQLDAETLIAVETAVFNHVQSCFAREAELSDQIAAAANPIALTAAVEAFWP